MTDSIVHWSTKSMLWGTAAQACMSSRMPIPFTAASAIEPRNFSLEYFLFARESVGTCNKNYISVIFISHDSPEM